MKNDRARELEAPREQRHEADEHIESSEGSVPKGPGKSFRNAVEWFNISGETLVMSAGLFSLILIILTLILRLRWIFEIDS